MAENTFLGLQPYTEADAYRFKGRTEESQDLFRLIVRNDYTVCYAESGEGKTSLLNAGVFPLLRENMYFPIAITFTSDDYKVTPDSFDTIIDRCIKDSIAEYNGKNKGVNVEYKLCSTDFQGLERQEELQRELSKFSWWKLRNYRPQAMGLTFTPVFIFDQFEEVFNLPGSIVWTKKFFDWLEDVSSDSCPDEIVKKVREFIGDKAAFPPIKEEKGFKAVFSLRKEFIGELDYWGMQMHFIPALKDNRYCLKALTYEGAKKVMAQQKNFDNVIAGQLLSYFVMQYSTEPEGIIAENLPIIPALLLSVVCKSWEKNIDFFSHTKGDGIGLSLNKILYIFFNDAINNVLNELLRKGSLINQDLFQKELDAIVFALVDGNGKRVRRKTTSSKLKDVNFDEKYKYVLCENRIIKISKIDGEDYVELIHDALCPVIIKRKEQRIAEEARIREEEQVLARTQKLQTHITELDRQVKKQQSQIREKDTALFYAKLYKKWKQSFEEKRYNEAIEYLKESAEGGDLDALNDLVWQLFRGTVYPNSIESAEQYARRGAELGNAGCQLWLGQILKETNRNEEALRWLIKSAEQKQGWAQYLVGEMYEKGQGAPKDMGKAIYWYRQSAKNHMNYYHEEAEKSLIRLGVAVYQEGEYMKLVKQAHIWHHDTAKELYDYEGKWWHFHKEPEKFAALLTAAEQGYPYAQEELGRILISNDARELGLYDEVKSKEWLAKAAVGFVEYIKDLEVKVNAGNVDAMAELGNIYYRGLCNKEKNVSMAENYYRMGAKLGHDGCQLWLGQILREKGQKSEALLLFEESGNQGQGWSAYLAGEMYENGEGTPKNMKKAIEWYNKSAKTNNSYAQNAKDALKRLARPIPEEKDDNDIAVKEKQTESRANTRKHNRWYGILINWIKERKYVITIIFMACDRLFGW